MQQIAFLGLGVMGRGMVANLIGAGYEVTVWNRTKEKADALVEQGAALAGTPAEAAGGADAVLYCLANRGARSRRLWRRRRAGGRRKASSPLT